jgi:signal transduction histidine kinase
MKERDRTDLKTLVHGGGDPTDPDARLALADERHKLATVFRESPAAMALWRGPDLIFEMVNPVYQAIFGERRLVGLPLVEALPELKGQEFPELLLEVFTTGEPFVGREVLARLAPREGAPLQDYYYDFTYVRIDDINGQPWGVYDHAMDVTDRVVTRRKNEELLEQNRALLESERLARIEAEEASRAKDDFLATLSHELRTPLSSILGWSQLLLAGEPTPEEIREGLESIEKRARMQSLLVDDLLDMSRIVGGNLRLDIRQVERLEFIESAIETVTPAASAKNITIDLEVGSDARPLPCDPDRLQQVIWNLLSNAIKFTPSGGTVRVCVTRSDSELQVRVEDDGAGIPSDLLPHIFDRFRQGQPPTRRRRAGLGLGLPIAKQLVELHGGTIKAESGGIDRGSRFLIRLPVLPPSHRNR